MAETSNIRQLVGRTTDDLGELMRAEVALAKAELRREMQDAVKGTVLLVMSLLPVMIGAFALVWALAWLVATRLGNPAGFAIVGGALVVLGGLFGLGAINRFMKVRGLPRTRETLTHDLPERLK